MLFTYPQPPSQLIVHSHLGQLGKSLVRKLDSPCSGSESSGNYCNSGSSSSSDQILLSKNFYLSIGSRRKSFPRKSGVGAGVKIQSSEQDQTWIAMRANRYHGLELAFSPSHVTGVALGDIISERIKGCREHLCVVVKAHSSCT